MVKDIEIYNDVIKVILKPTKKFLNGYFYTDNNPVALSLVNSYTWYLSTQGNITFVKATIGTPSTGQKTILFHQEYAKKVLGYHPDYLDHINGIELDNRNENLNIVNVQQNTRNKPSIGYKFVVKGNCFIPYYALDYKVYYRGSYRTEPEALLAVYELRKQAYSDYNYNFYLDRRDDLNILDLELTGKINYQQSIYLHVKRYVESNPWYVYRYNLFDYCRNNNIIIPAYTLDEQGFMIHSVTKQRLCPY